MKGKLQVKTSKKALANGNGIPVSSPAAATSRIPTKGKVMGSVPSCTKCGIVITEDAKALQCDRCQQDNWKCTECLNLPPDKYDQLLSDAGMSCNLRWFCDDCDKAVMDTMNKSETKGDKIECLIGLMEKLMDKFDSIDDRLRDKCEVSRVIQVENRIRVLEDRFATQDQGLNHKIL